MEKILRKEWKSSRENIRILVQTGLFAALGCVATMVLQVPSPNGGYMNLGDAVVILGAWLWVRLTARLRAASDLPWRIFCRAM